MTINREWTRYRVAAMWLGCILAFCHATAAGAEAENTPSEEDAEQGNVDPVQGGEWQAYTDVRPFAEDVDGYQPRGRVVGTPIDVETDLNRSFPKRDSILPRIIPSGWFNWKEDLNEKYGFKLSLSYQSIYQRAPTSETRTGVNAAWGGWALLEASWKLLNRDQDYEGSLVAALDYRHNLGNKPSPVNWGLLEAGSQWWTDPSIVEWDPWTPILFWEQWLKQDRFVTRLGNQNVLATLDFMRYKDSRVAFSGGPHTAPSHVIPHPGPGFGAMFEWWPIEESKLYVLGTLNDQNFEVEKITWDDAISEGDFFYALEVGNNWRHEGGLDHLHALVYYADAPIEQVSPSPRNEPGWGFKVYGEKQSGRVVGYGGYTYNTAEGGPFGVTLAKHAVTAGAALSKPFGIGGEFNVGAAWAQPINQDLRSQFSIEAYWKLLLFPSMWLTPGVQFIFDPTLNPEQDQISVAQLKFRVFF